MATATIGALKVVLGLDSAQFEDGLNAAQKHLRGVGKSMQSIGQTMAGVGAGLSVAITAPLIAAGFAASKAATEAADAMGQVEASLTSMGNASGRTKEQLADLATGIMKNSLLDDDDVLRQVTANLLTFGSVSGTVFDRAQQAIVDYSAKTGRDLLGATTMIGKALQDPVKGVNALTRAGVKLDESQIGSIKSMVAMGNVAGAQGVILAELEKQYKGSAAAAQATDPYDKMRDSLNDLSESMGAIVNQYIAPILAGVAAMADGFNALSPAVQNIAFVGAVIAAAIGPALVVIGSIVSAIGTLTAAFATGGLLVGVGAFAVAAAPFVAAGAAIAAVLYVFRDELMPIFAEFGKAVMEAIGPSIPPIIAAAKEAFAALQATVTALAAVVGPILVTLGKTFVDVFGPVILTALRVVVAGVQNAFEIIAQAMRVITALLKGDWSGAWNAAGTLVMTVVRGVLRVIEALAPGAIDAMRRMVDGIREFLGGQLSRVFDGVKSKVGEVKDAFFNLYDAVVGNSYVPDMVIEVGQWMAKLDEVMVRPASAATSKAAEAFEDLRARARVAIEGMLTDRERLSVELLRGMEEDARLMKAGAFTPEQFAFVSSRRQAQFRTDSAGLDAEGLTTGPDRQVNQNFPEVDRLQQTWADIQQRIRNSRDDFASAFSYGIDAAMRGDWKGVLQSIVGSVFKTSLEDVGKVIFDLFNGGKGGGGISLAKIGSTVASFFGGGAKLPGFKDGGSFKVGGLGGIDSKVMSFRATPGEMVDIRKPGEGGAMGGAYFDLRGAVMTHDLLRQMNEIGTVHGDRAYSRSMTGAPKLTMSQTAQQQQHTVGRKTR